MPTNSIKNTVDILKDKFSIYLSMTIFVIFAYILATPETANLKTIFVTLISFFATGFIISYAIKRNLEIHKLFLLFAILFGLGYSVVIPFTCVPDEILHFYRIFSISEGHILTPATNIGVGDSIPVSLTDTYNTYKEIAAAFGKTVDYSERQFVTFASSALYSPICYIPQVIGMVILRLFTDNAAIIFCGTRLFNLMFSIVAIYYSIKLIPYGKMLIFSIAMLPMTLHQLISVSADGPAISLAIFCVSTALFISQENVDLKKRDLILLSLALFVLSMCKIVYIFFILLVFIIPGNKFKSKKISLIYKFAFVFLILAINIIWLRITSRYFIEFQEGVDIKEQVSFVLHNPLHYFQIIIKTLYINAEDYLKMLSGSSLGLLTYPINVFGFGTALLVLILCLFGCSGNNYPFVQKMLMLVIVVVTVGLTFSALYAQWTPVGNDTVKGIQGRYFIPLLLPMSTFMPQIAFTSNDAAYEKSGKYMLYMLMMFANFVALTNCFYHILAS